MMVAIVKSDARKDESFYFYAGLKELVSTREVSTRDVSLGPLMRVIDLPVRANTDQQREDAMCSAYKGALETPATLGTWVQKNACLSRWVWIMQGTQLNKGRWSDA
jgi:hypothetical protein